MRSAAVEGPARSSASCWLMLRWSPPSSRASWRGLQPLAGADLPGPVVAFHLDGQPLGVGGAAGDRRLLVAAGGEMGLQPRQLLGGRLAVADGLAEDLQALGAGVLGAQPGQPLAGHRRRGADLGRQLGGVEPPATGQLPAQVGVGDPVPHQPRPQLPQRRDRGPRWPRSTRSRSRARPGATLTSRARVSRVDRLAGVDLTRQPGIGDPLPGRPRIGRPLLLGRSAMLAASWSRVIAGPLPAPARPRAPPPPGPARGPGGAGCA